MRIRPLPCAMAGLLLACGTDAPPASDTGEVPIAVPDSIRAELVELGGEDQAVREGLTPAAVRDTARLRRMLRGDSARTRRLREIVDRYGWPTAGTAGPEAAGAAFLILQHSPDDGFQRSLLPTLEALAEDGALAPSDVALLIDRVLLAGGDRQRYGTQFSFEDGALVMDPVEDEAGLAERRRAMGLPPMEEYVRVLEEVYGVADPDSASTTPR